MSDIIELLTERCESLEQALGDAESLRPGFEHTSLLNRFVELKQRYDSAFEGKLPEIYSVYAQAMELIENRTRLVDSVLTPEERECVVLSCEADIRRSAALLSTLSESQDVLDQDPRLSDLTAVNISLDNIETMLTSQLIGQVEQLEQDTEQFLIQYNQVIALQSQIFLECQERLSFLEAKAP